MGAKFRRGHVCLHFQATNSVSITGSMTASGWLFGIFINIDTFSELQRNGSALLRYTVLISVQELIQMIKSSTTDSLRIQRDSRKISLLALENFS